MLGLLIHYYYLLLQPIFISNNFLNLKKQNLIVIIYVPTHLRIS